MTSNFYKKSEMLVKKLLFFHCDFTYISMEHCLDGSSLPTTNIACLGLSSYRHNKTLVLIGCGKLIWCVVGVGLYFGVFRVTCEVKWTVMVRCASTCPLSGLPTVILVIKVQVQGKGVRGHWLGHRKGRQIGGHLASCFHGKAWLKSWWQNLEGFFLFL